MLLGVRRIFWVAFARREPEGDRRLRTPFNAAIRRYSRGGITALFQALICAIISARMTLQIVMDGTDCHGGRAVAMNGNLGSEVGIMVDDLCREHRLLIV